MIKNFFVKKLSAHNFPPLYVFVSGIFSVITGITQICTFGLVICNLNAILIDWAIYTRCGKKYNLHTKPFEIGFNWRFRKEGSNVK